MHFNQRSVNKLLVHVKATWKPELLISESLISFPPHHDPLPALFFLLELKTLSAGSLQGCRMLSRLWSSLALSLIIICSGWRCQLNACEVKIQTVQRACPERAEQTDESLVFSLCSVLSAADPPAIVQQRAASLHMFWFIVQSRCVSPPAHSCNRPC